MKLMFLWLFIGTCSLLDTAVCMLMGQLPVEDEQRHVFYLVAMDNVVLIDEDTIMQQIMICFEAFATCHPTVLCGMQQCTRHEVYCDMIKRMKQHARAVCSCWRERDAATKIARMASAFQGKVTMGEGDQSTCREALLCCVISIHECFLDSQGVRGVASITLFSDERDTVDATIPPDGAMSHALTEKEGEACCTYQAILGHVAVIMPRALAEQEER